MPKYVFVDGRMILDPQYSGPDTGVLATVSDPTKALLPACSMEDANAAVTATNLPMPQTTRYAFEHIQQPEYVNAFGVGNQINGGGLLEGLSNVFLQYQMPIGLSSKLMQLRGLPMHFAVDDSGSMDTLTRNGKTRWQNVKSRLLRMIDLLQFVPTGTITISFLDRSNIITLNRAGKTPEQFRTEAIQKIENAFRNGPNGSTPIFRKIKQMLRQAVGKTMLYLFTDGQPDDGIEEIENITNLLTNRSNPQNTPFSFLCCSDQPTTTLWMHEVEEIACRPGRAGYVAAQQNFEEERLEVLNDQGPAFPYSETLWSLCNLLAASDPFVLDALNQHAPLTKPTIEHIFGRSLSPQEYYSYFSQHPNAMWLFREDYASFLEAPLACMIPSVNLFETTLSNLLYRDINQGNVVSESFEIGRTEQTVLAQLGRARPPEVAAARLAFWQNHYRNLEQNQFQQLRQQQTVRRDLWQTYYTSHPQTQAHWQSYSQQPIIMGTPAYNIQLAQRIPPVQGTGRSWASFMGINSRALQLQRQQMAMQESSHTLSPYL